MQEINITELKEHPLNTKFFDDMVGGKWDEFIESVKTSGIIEPIVATTDMVIVSGHQRVRACKELGIDKIMCEFKAYKDDDAIVKDLLETNIRQRGDIGGSAKKVGLRIKELERLYGIKQGGDRGNQYQEASGNNCRLPNQSDLAEKLEMSLRSLRNYKKLTEMIPELEELVSTGITTPTSALAIMRNLSENEQLELISSLDTTKKITQKEIQKEMQKYIVEKKELENRVKQLESQPPEIKVVDNTDYSLKAKNEELEKSVSDYKFDYKNLQNQFDSKVSEMQNLRKQIEAMKETSPTEQYNKKLKDSTIFFCSKVADFIEKTGGYVWLTEHINELPDYEKKSYISAVNAVNSWSNILLDNINN